jgi:two-component system response regulator AtoC
MNQTQQHKIVILDNNQHRRDALKTMVAEWGYTPFIFEKESRCLDNLGPLDPDLVISGSLSSVTAARFIHTLQLTKCGVPLVIISDDLEIRAFVENNGFVDVSVLDVNSNLNEIKSAVDRILQNEAGRRENPDYCPLIIGGSPQLIHIKKIISGIDDIDEPLLIQGEPGTGKELLARFIHLKSKRHHGPFVKLSMPRLAADFFENQLLILEDPQERQKGIFAAAHQGTLLLEEIGDMPVEPQATLLKIIDSAGISRPADDAYDVRIITTSSRDLAALIGSGKFRKDLFYRLNVMRIDVPPLRSRTEDIPALSDFFTDKICIESGRSHFELSDQMKNLFACYHWPGNIQQLEDTIKQIVVHGAGDRVVTKLRVHKKSRAIVDSYEDISTLAGLNDVQKHLKGAGKIPLKKIGGIFMERAEKKLVKKALESTNWNRKRAAKLLDISYKSLLNKIKEYKLT